MKVLVAAVLIAVFLGVAYGSSHSEAPGTAKRPPADLTDLYFFRSYEQGRDDRVVFLLNAYPLQNPIAGPNYFTLSSDHFFEINVSNDGDTQEDFTFQFFFGADLGGSIEEHLAPDEDDCDDDDIITVTRHSGTKLTIGTEEVAVALKFTGPISASNPDGNLNWKEYYQINYIEGGRDNAQQALTRLGTSDVRFRKPFDYAGEKTFGSASDYENYARTFIHQTDIPGCSAGAAKVFVGQRKESFHISLGKVFDLVNFIPVSSFSGGIEDCENGKNNALDGINVATIALEMPISCLRAGSGTDNDVLSAWASVRRLRHSGNNHIAEHQISRMGQPLVNELFIGLKDKFLFSQGHPSGDGAVATYVTHPTFPAILNLLFLQTVRDEVNDQSIAQIQPDNIPRQDLFVTFLEGVPGITRRSDVVVSEQLRLNVTFPAVSASNQNSYGVIGGDNSGFPNGRRPGDDAVDIALRVSMGALCHTGITEFQCDADNAPFGAVPFTDGAPVHATDFDDFFPFMTTPNPGSRTDPDPGSCEIEGNAASSLIASALLIVAAFIALLF